MMSALRSLPGERFGLGRAESGSGKIDFGLVDPAPDQSRLAISRPVQSGLDDARIGRSRTMTASADCALAGHCARAARVDEFAEPGPPPHSAGRLPDAFRRSRAFVSVIVKNSAALPALPRRGRAAGDRFAPPCYPHELSGGMKQRACIAIAIFSLRPKVIIRRRADQARSDVVVQRQGPWRPWRGCSRNWARRSSWSAHDMGLMAQFVDRLGIMYAGRTCRGGRPISRQSIARPRHPYTRAALDRRACRRSRRVACSPASPALAPSLRELPSGLRLHTRALRAGGSIAAAPNAPVAAR